MDFDGFACQTVSLVPGPVWILWWCISDDFSLVKQTIQQCIDIKKGENTLNIEIIKKNFGVFLETYTAVLFYFSKTFDWTTFTCLAVIFHQEYLYIYTHIMMCKLPMPWTLTHHHINTYCMLAFEPCTETTWTQWLRFWNADLIHFCPLYVSLWWAWDQRNRGLSEFHLLCICRHRDQIYLLATCSQILVIMTFIQSCQSLMQCCLGDQGSQPFIAGFPLCHLRAEISSDSLNHLMLWIVRSEIPKFLSCCETLFLN